MINNLQIVLEYQHKSNDEKIQAMREFIENKFELLQPISGNVKEMMDEIDEKLKAIAHHNAEQARKEIENLKKENGNEKR